MSKSKISFCITCMEQFEHLNSTFLKNIADNQDYIDSSGNVEFVLLNYGGDKDMDEWAF